LQEEMNVWGRFNFFMEKTIKYFKICIDSPALERGRISRSAKYLEIGYERFNKPRRFFNFHRKFLCY